MLSDSDSETNDLHTLTINQHYAKAFEYKKEREEFVKLKEKYGSDYSESGDSDANHSQDSEDTEEDSDGEELTPAVDAAILRTLARIRKRDPAIYEGDRRVFEEEHTLTQEKAPAVRPKPKEKSKPLTIREAALASALADSASRSRSPSPGPRLLTHAEEQALLRSETRAAFHSMTNSEAQEDDDLLIPRSRMRDETELEEEEYRAFLEREVGEDLNSLITVNTSGAVGTSESVEIVGDGDKQHGGKKKKGEKGREREKERDQEKGDVQGEKTVKKLDTRSKEEADQKFLMNYILNRGWMDLSNRRVPTYNEIIEPSSKRWKQKSTKFQPGSEGVNDADQNSDDDQTEARGLTLSDEESFDDLADAFETSYNFRFEEPGGALIASFPRNSRSARREPTTRRDARTRKKERQAAEKQELLQVRREEIRRERTLVEAAAATKEPADKDMLVIGKDAPNKKKSKTQQRKEELARLKVLKANELRRKLEIVSLEGSLSGVGDEALVYLDLDADWDPSKHDAQMAELYGGEDDIAEREAEKPIWDDDIDVGDIVPPTSAESKTGLKKQKKKKKHSKSNEDVGVDVNEMDADLVTGWDDWDNDNDSGEWKGTEDERKRKVDAYMDEVVNRLGFSGITSHMPTRFHYTPTAPENYGLAPAEILLATDAELNSYVGLKKMAPYRVEKSGRGNKNWDTKRVQRLKEFRETLRSRVGSRYEGAWSLDTTTHSKSRTAEAGGEKKQRKGKKERAKLKAAQGGHDGEGDDANNTDIRQDLESMGKSQKRERDSNAGSYSDSLQADKEGDDGVQRKKRKRRHKKRSGEGAAVVS